MSELNRAHDHMKAEVYALVEAILLRNMGKAREHAATVVQLINHIDKLEIRTCKRYVDSR